MKHIYKNLGVALPERLKKIRFIATDFDGCLTDNTVIHDQHGIESIVRSRSDSLSIDLLHQAGLYNKDAYESLTHEVDLMIMSKEKNPVVKSVAEKIKMKALQGEDEKFNAFQHELQKRTLTSDQAIFIGNDLNDLECVQHAGIGVAVADALPHILKTADYVTKAKGGHGAFREVIELVLYAKGKHPYQVYK